MPTFICGGAAQTTRECCPAAQTESAPKKGGNRHANPNGLSQCPNCGRTFNPKSLQIHLKSCGGSHGISKPVNKHVAEVRVYSR